MLLNLIIDSWMRTERYNSFLDYWFRLYYITSAYTHTVIDNSYLSKMCSNVWKWSEENRITLPKQTLTPSPAGRVLCLCKGEKRSIFTYTREKKHTAYTQHRNDELTALCNLITSYYSQLDRCLFYSFSISFLPSFSSASMLSVFVVVRFFWYSHTHTCIFRHLFMWALCSLFYVDVCLISRDERFEWTQLDWKERNRNYKQSIDTHDRLVRSFEFTLFSSPFQCVESFSVGRNVCEER